MVVFKIVYKMREYKILRDTDSKITKKLNQWRHDFDLEIVSIHLDNRVTEKGRPWGNLIVFLTRKRKT